MSKPTSRVLALLELLQAGGIRTAAGLAGELGVDERTARRYVQHLRELDIPVEAVRGMHGGYRLARHSRLPPLMFTDDEALAVVWALMADRRAGEGPASGPAASSASAKLRRVLPAALARRIDAVVHAVSFTAPPPPPRHGSWEESGDAAAGPRVLLALAEAARDRRLVLFGYLARSGEPSQRRVQPHGIVAHRDRLYLSGLDLTRDAIRTFRLDRIETVTVLADTFAAPGAVDPVRQVLGPLAPARGLHDVSVRVHADVAHVRSWIPETLASVTSVPDEDGRDDWVRILLRVERLEWVVGTLVMLDRPFLVERPEVLRELTVELTSRSAAVARSTTSAVSVAAWSGAARHR